MDGVLIRGDAQLHDPGGDWRGILLREIGELGIGVYCTQLFQADGENAVQMTKRVKYRAYPSNPLKYGTYLPDIIASCFKLDPEQRLGMKDTSIIRTLWSHGVTGNWGLPTSDLRREGKGRRHSR